MTAFVELPLDERKRRAEAATKFLRETLVARRRGCKVSVLGGRVDPVTLEATTLSGGTLYDAEITLTPGGRARFTVTVLLEGKPTVCHVSGVSDLRLEGPCEANGRTRARQAKPATRRTSGDE